MCLLVNSSAPYKIADKAACHAALYMQFSSDSEGKDRDHRGRGSSAADFTFPQFLRPLMRLFGSSVISKSCRLFAGRKNFLSG